MLQPRAGLKNSDKWKIVNRIDVNIFGILRKMLNTVQNKRFLWCFWCLLLICSASDDSVDRVCYRWHRWSYASVWNATSTRRQWYGIVLSGCISTLLICVSKHRLVYGFCYHSNKQGSHGSWKVVKFEFGFFRTWKVLKLDRGAEKVLNLASVFLKTK